MTNKIAKPGTKRGPRSREKDDRLERRLRNAPRFLRRIEEARKSLRAGRGTLLEDVA